MHCSQHPLTAARERALCCHSHLAFRCFTSHELISSATCTSETDRWRCSKVISSHSLIRGDGRIALDMIDHVVMSQAS